MKSLSPGAVHSIAGALALALGTVAATPSATTKIDRLPSVANQQLLSVSDDADDPKPMPAYIERALDWLAAAQFENGGWGAGAHSAQSVRDPKAVKIDPATTAFSGLALIRSGNTLKTGPYATNLKRTLEYLLTAVEEFPEEGPFITNVTGTQPQAKLGRNIDASMVAQFFTRILSETEHDKKLQRRVENALDKCLRKLQSAQHADGSWNDGGWAPVLQSAMANSALEMAAGVGRDVDEEILRKSRAYQGRNIGEDGDVRTEAAAGIALYSVASGQRAAAPVARDVRRRLKEAKKNGELREDDEINRDNIAVLGYSDDEAESVLQSYEQYKKASEILNDETVLSGFGNNGGEEFLSYMMTSEALAAAGGDEWDAWYDKMNSRLEKVQNPNGSWSGHHCITSPVFSTAAVIMTMTADRDLDYIAKR